MPQVQPQAAHLTLFQRTAPWVLPKADRPIPGYTFDFRHCTRRIDTEDTS